jgi:membrane-bound lytic murein transglycosylase MltF
LANCEQVGQILYNTTRASAGQVSTYEDLWRFTLVNYNAGPGCLTNAVEQAYNNYLPLTWENVIQYLDPVCQTSIDYVNDISYMP